VWAELAPDGGARTYRTWSGAQAKTDRQSHSFPCWRLLASPDALLGQDTSIRDKLFMGRNIQELSARDTSVGDTLTLHPQIER